MKMNARKNRKIQSKRNHIIFQTLRYDVRLSKKGRRVDALALRADEGRDKLR